ncbi:IRC3 [Symbiodinium sp. CCMP2456]|nr:IRC3 [Symbiodinium sp. CCMP2456]
MACGTGKTRVIRELAQNVSGKVLITVPSRLLLEQFAADFPSFCKVGTGYNKHINRCASGFIAVTNSVNLLQDCGTKVVFVDEAHHPLPSDLPECEELFLFSATHSMKTDYEYGMGQAIQERVLCDYDLTVPMITEGHPYSSLARLLQSSQGRFRRVLAYCNSVAEAQRAQQIFATFGIAVWHINSETSRLKRQRVIQEFSGDLQRPVHVLVTVQVLGEGVNIPNADTCMFVQPRNSYTSIVQAVGRILRLHVCKPMAHVILPAVSLFSVEPPVALESNGIPVSCGGGGLSKQDTLRSVSKTETRADPEFAAVRCENLQARVRATEPTSDILGQPKKPGSSGRTASAEVVAFPCVAERQRRSFRHASAASENVILGNRVRHGAGPETALSKRQNCRPPVKQGVKAGNVIKRRVLQSEGLKLSGAMRMQMDDPYDSQLERFLSVIAHADSGLASSSLRFRLSFADCRASANSNIMSITQEVMCRLETLLNNRGPWDDRFEELQSFVQRFGRVPTHSDKEHRSLFYWIKNTGAKSKAGRLPAHRLQKFLDSPFLAIRQRAATWHDPAISFRSYCKRLRDYVLKFQVVPRTPSLHDAEGKTLAVWLQGQRRTVRTLLHSSFSKSRSDGAFKRDALAALHPLVADCVESWNKPISLRSRKESEKRWREVLAFVSRTDSLPKSNRGTLQNRLYQRLVKLRLRLPWLPTEEQLKILSSHRRIADFMNKPV